MLIEQLREVGTHRAMLVQAVEASGESGESGDIPAPDLNDTNIYAHTVLGHQFFCNPLYDNGIPLDISTTSGLRETVPSFGSKAHIRYTYTRRNPVYSLLEAHGEVLGDRCIVTCSMGHMFDDKRIVDERGVLNAEEIENYLQSIDRPTTPLQSQVLRRFVGAMEGVPSGGSKPITIQLARECAEVDAMTVLVSYLCKRFTRFIVHDAAFVCTVCEGRPFSFARLFEEKRLVLCPCCDVPTVPHGRYRPNSRMMHNIGGLYSHCARMLSFRQHGICPTRQFYTEQHESHELMRQEIEHEMRVVWPLRSSETWLMKVWAQVERMLVERGLEDLVIRILHHAHRSSHHDLCEQAHCVVESWN